MLTDRAIALVKATVPVLEQHGETLTRHFYRRMFEKNPEVAPLFNPANQSQGTQQKALAAAICSYAANIDNLEVLGGAVELIAQKHASLQIQAEQYPIVGENLLASIREVLKDVATDEIIDAWGEAYQFLADILIGRERQIYHEHESALHGWKGFKPFRVIRVEPESEIIVSFYLEPADGQGLPAFKPGQYISVRVPTPDGSTTMRNYSLSDKPGQSWFRVSIKREMAPAADAADGFVSNFFHDKVQEGTTIEVGPPCGEFFLDLPEKHERPLVLLAAGIGITPLLSMLLSAEEATPDRQIFFLHACLNGRVHAFKKTVDHLAEEHPNLVVRYRYNFPTDADRAQVERGDIGEGVIDAELIEDLIPDHDGDYYFCGPKPFMVGIYHQLLMWGMPPAQAHFEFFGPRQELQRA